MKDDNNTYSLFRGLVLHSEGREFTHLSAFIVVYNLNDKEVKVYTGTQENDHLVHAALSPYNRERRRYSLPVHLDPC